MKVAVSYCVAEAKRCEQRFANASEGRAVIASVVRAVQRAAGEEMA